MLTRILAVVAALLAALVVHQYNQIGQLRAEVADARERGMVQARATLIESMQGQGAEIQRAMEWLNAYYKDAEGLGRPEGLWISGHPDYEGMSVWIFDVYLRNRLKGGTEQDSRQAVVDAIRQSEEWRVKHRGQS